MELGRYAHVQKSVEEHPPLRRQRRDRRTLAKNKRRHEKDRRALREKELLPRTMLHHINIKTCITSHISSNLGIGSWDLTSSSSFYMVANTHVSNYFMICARHVELGLRPQSLCLYPTCDLSGYMNLGQPSLRCFCNQSCLQVHSY